MGSNTPEPTTPQREQSSPVDALPTTQPPAPQPTPPPQLQDLELTPAIDQPHPQQQPPLDTSKTHKSKRELPPLKKTRSSKLMEPLANSQKENTVPPQAEPSSKQEITVFQQVAEEGNVQCDFRETRTKKLRLSKKQQTVPGPYF